MVLDRCTTQVRCEATPHHRRHGLLASRTSGHELVSEASSTAVPTGCRRLRGRRTHSSGSWSQARSEYQGIGPLTTLSRGKRSLRTTVNKSRQLPPPNCGLRLNPLAVPVHPTLAEMKVSY